MEISLAYVNFNSSLFTHGEYVPLILCSHMLIVSILASLSEGMMKLRYQNTS